MENLFETVSKITQPLAALCFIVLIFYLYRRTVESRKEKGLKANNVSDRTAAARAIINEHPDIQLDTIDAQNAVPIAKEIVMNKLKTYRLTIIGLIILTLIFTIAFVIVEYMKSRITPCPDCEANASWAKSQSIKKKANYSLSSVIQHIKLKKEIKEGKEFLLAEFRNEYIVCANRDISAKESAFDEIFTSNYGKISPHAGSHNQDIVSENPLNFHVRFSAQKHQNVALNTGADYKYELPLPDQSSPSCFEHLNIRANEWFTCYPNQYDYIDELVIIIEAENFDITLPTGPSLFRRTGNDQEAGQASCQTYQSDNKCTLVCIWDKVGPGECVGLKIHWDL